MERTGIGTLRSTCQKTFFDTLAEAKEDAKTSKPDLRLYSLYAWVRFVL